MHLVTYLGFLLIGFGGFGIAVPNFAVSAVFLIDLESSLRPSSRRSGLRFLIKTSPLFLSYLLRVRGFEPPNTSV